MSEDTFRRGYYNAMSVILKEGKGKAWVQHHKKVALNDPDQNDYTRGWIAACDEVLEREDKKTRRDDCKLVKDIRAILQKYPHIEFSTAKDGNTFLFSIHTDEYSREPAFIASCVSSIRIAVPIKEFRGHSLATLAEILAGIDRAFQRAKERKQKSNG